MSEQEVIMKLPKAQFPFWFGAVLCVKWGQRTSAGSGQEGRERSLPDAGVNSLEMPKTGLRFTGVFVGTLVKMIVCVTWICRMVTFGDRW